VERGAVLSHGLGRRLVHGEVDLLGLLSVRVLAAAAVSAAVSMSAPVPTTPSPGGLAPGLIPSASPVTPVNGPGVEPLRAAERETSAKTAKGCVGPSVVNTFPGLVGAVGIEGLHKFPEWHLSLVVGIVIVVVVVVIGIACHDVNVDDDDDDDDDD
jgi:hypothetical protein